MLTPRLVRITIYPLKSFDGQTVESARVLASGAMEFDRRWALVDADGRFVNGKRTARVQRIRSVVDVARQMLQVADEASTATFSLAERREEAEQWLSTRVGEAVQIVEDAQKGFPDDTEAPGPTVISTATLETVGRWFDLPLDDVRRRFRANLEIGGVPSFWEDRLLGSPGETVSFSIGTARFLGTNPCQRCVVPTRDPASGAVTATFAQRFAKLREEHLPAWAAAERFNHFYRLAVNTRLAGAIGGERLQVGDEVVIE